MATISATNFYNLQGDANFTVDRDARTVEDTSGTPTNFNPTGGTFTDNNWTLLTTRVQQSSSDVTITMTDCTWVFTEDPGAAGLSAATAPLGITGASNILWQLERHTFLGNAGTAATGFGVVEAGVLDANGFIRNSRFLGIREDGTTNFGSWFSNYAAIPSGFQLANINYIRTAINLPNDDAILNAAFDGYVRLGAGLNNYTVRLQGNTAAWTLIHNTTFADDGVYLGDGVTNTGTAGGIFQNNTTATNPLSTFSVNNLYEPDEISVFVTGAPRLNVDKSIIRDCFAWRPIFTDATDGANIADIRMYGFFGNNIYPGHATINAATLGTEPTVIPDPTLASSAGNISDNGYWIQVGESPQQFAPPQNVIHTFDKALEFTRDANGRLQLRTGYTAPDFVTKSWTHNINTTVTAVPNDFTLADNGAVMYTNTEVVSAVPDANIPAAFTGAMADDHLDGTTPLADVDNLYAIAKRFDYLRSTAQPIPTVNGSVLDYGNVNIVFDDLIAGYAYNSTTNILSIPTAAGDLVAGTNINTIMVGPTNTITLQNGVTQGDNITLIDTNSPGANDVIFEIPLAWRQLAGAYYAFTTTTNVLESGLTTDASSRLITGTGGAGVTVRLALVHPAYSDVILTAVSSSTAAVTVTAGPPVLNPLFSTDANTVYDGGDTAASYFGVYDGSPAVSPSVGTDPNDGSFMSVESLQNAATNAKRLNGTRMNNIAHNFKGNAFGARYAQVAAISNTSPVTATATTGVTISNLINFAYSQPASIENGAVVIQGIEGSLQVQQGTRTGFDSPVIDYDIVEGRVISGSGSALDNRLLDRQNNIDSALLIPRTES